MSDQPAVRVERDGPVTTVILSRPAVRNAVDGPTATALADAFLAFERDDEAKVGVFFGEHGTFCAGADLKAVSDGRGNRVEEPVTGDDWDPLGDGSKHWKIHGHPKVFGVPRGAIDKHLNPIAHDNLFVAAWYTRARAITDGRLTDPHADEALANTLRLEWIHFQLTI